MLILLQLRILSKNFQKLFFIIINRICRNKLLKLVCLKCTRYYQITLKFILTVLEGMCRSMCFYSLSRCGRKKHSKIVWILRWRSPPLSPPSLPPQFPFLPSIPLFILSFLSSFHSFSHILFSPFLLSSFPLSATLQNCRCFSHS